MSASQFDDLLGDFGDSSTTTTTTTTTKTSSNGAFDDDFDPFGPSSQAAPTSNGGDSGLLLDFSADAEVQNGGSSNGVDLQFTTSADTVNPLSDMSADTQSSNPLYDLSSGTSANPLYDLSSDADANQSANPLYGFSTETTSSSAAPTNPLYDFDIEGTNDNAQQEVDFLSGTNQQQEEEVLEEVDPSHPAPASGDLLGDFESPETAQSQDIVNLEYEEPQIMNGDPKHWFGTQEIEEQQQEEEDVEEEQLLDYSERVERVDEAPAPMAVTEESTVEDDESSESPTVPVVEITESPEQTDEPQPEDAAEVQRENLPDLVVREEGDEVAEIAAEMATEIEEDVSETPEPESSPAASGQSESVAVENFGRDRREVDLEHYCMDREESDYMEDQDIMEHHMDSLKPREERSRSPSRSIGPDTPEDRERLEPSDTPEDTDATDECEQLRPREDRSHAPSRSLEPEERQKDNSPPRETTTYRSSSTIILSPTSGSPPSPRFGDSAVFEEEIKEDGRTVSKTTRTENRYSGSDSTQATWEEARNQQNAGEQDLAHFSEMSSVKNKFESPADAPAQRQFDYQQEVLTSEGGEYENEPQPSQQWQNEEEEEEGVYESQPIQRGDVVREADTDRGQDLPAVGTAQSLKAKFLAESQQASTPKTSKREITPPIHGGGGEFVSEPRAQVEHYEGKPEAGVFESQPAGHNPEIITSETALEDATYERGYAKSAAAKYKELATKSYTPSAKRELTPDRSGQVEYVSEPRGEMERYEGKAESGVFESEPQVNPDVVRSGEAVSEEPLPERGTAKNLANRFKQISESSTYSSPRGKKELTPDRSGQVEYVSEPRGGITEEYEVRVDAGVFENQPQRSADIVTSDSVPEEFVPEKGFAKNVAARFKELESTAKSPPLSPGRRKEFTPPREDEHARTSGVLENTPQVRPDVIHSDDHLEEKLPERGTAKNIAQRYRQMEAENKSPTSPRQKKEFTPPPQGSGGVYENQPKEFHADYNRPAESGIIENTPLRRDDVIRADEPKQEADLPERGAAKNLVSKWRQLESESAKARSPGSGRPKEFTPPREEPRIAEQRKSPRTPLSPGGQGQGELDNGSVHPSELPGQYQPQNEPSVFESQPQQREDVLREGDTDWAAGMPKKDTAKKMRAKFQSLQAEANKAAPPVARKDPADPKRRTPRKESECSEPDSDPAMEKVRQKFEDPEKVGRSKSMRAAIQTEKCGACEKTVYAMERLEMNKRVYHKACFRCTQCRAVLTPKTFAINNDVIFCTTHYKQLFATKGNYDEGFGRMQHKKRWSSNPNLAAQDGEGHGKQATVKS